jgi:bifunctional non-homologous end joining protein LigD
MIAFHCAPSRGTLCDVTTHRRTALPTFIPPMLATLVAAPFDSEDWTFEIKWDGFRVEAVIDHGRSRIWTRGQQDAAGYFGSFLDPIDWIAANEAIVDGEVIALDDRGEPDFALLQARIKGKERGGQTTPFVYEVFDLMWLDGRSLLDEPLEVRRSLLKDVLRPDPRVRLSEDIAGDGLAFFRAAQERGLEGVMAKDRRSRYEPGKRTMAWQKIKIRPEQELVVGGWAKGTGKAVELGSLLVGVYEDGRLRYAGKVGAGFNDAIRADLLAAMANLATDEQPFAEPPPRPVSKNALWLKPQLVIRAEFAGWTGDGLVRQAAYKGFDLGKDPRRVRREVARRAG